MSKFIKAFGVAAALVACLLLYASSFLPVTDDLPVEQVDRLGKASGLTDCFWIGNASDKLGVNYAYPDTGANYWIAQLKLPAGARLELDGQFPHARHLSFNSYDALGRPADRLNDTMIVPDEGALNPYLPGARRDAARRGYRVHVAAGKVQAGASMTERDRLRPPNTLYVPADAERVQLFLRVYVQDEGLGPKAGVALPRPRLLLADGSVVQGEALCQAIVVKAHALRDIHLGRQATRQLLALDSASSPYHPAQAEPHWRAFLNPPMMFASVLYGTSFEWLTGVLNKQRKGGFYSTLDNTYMVAFVDNRFGDALVLHGRAPSTPHTAQGNAVMAAGQLRYWSFCKYRSLYDTAVDSCVHDEQVPLDGDGNYTIVFSTPQTRPANARADCGVAWRAWGVGDGIDNPHGGMLVYRHMLPAPSFGQSIFATQGMDDEKAVLGPYYPRANYAAKAAFEARGCPLRS